MFRFNRLGFYATRNRFLLLAFYLLFNEYLAVLAKLKRQLVRVRVLHHVDALVRPLEACIPSPVHLLLQELRHLLCELAYVVVLFAHGSGGLYFIFI